MMDFFLNFTSEFRFQHSMMGVFFDFPSKNCPPKTQISQYLPEKLTILGNYLSSSCFTAPARSGGMGAKTLEFHIFNFMVFMGG